MGGTAGFRRRKVTKNKVIEPFFEPLAERRKQSAFWTFSKGKASRYGWVRSPRGGDLYMVPRHYFMYINMKNVPCNSL